MALATRLGERTVWILALLGVVGGFAVTWSFVEPAPPARIVMSTGSMDGTYHAVALRYQAALAAQGIELALVNSSGAMENLERLRSGEAQLALVQSGLSLPEDAEALDALGSLYLEPLWVFSRAEATPHYLSELEGVRAAMGAEGSGTRALAALLLEESGVAVEAVELGGGAAAEALLAGGVDVAFFVSGAGDAKLLRLLSDPAVRLMDMRRAPAFVTRHRFLEQVTLHEGLLDLQRNLPAADHMTVAATATLAARRDLHPAFTTPLLQAAAAVHIEGGLLEAPGAYPAPDHVDLPLSDEAAYYHEGGPSFLNRFLPFWAASLVDRLKILLLPLLTLAIPLARVAPPIYRWRIRSRIYQWYEDLRAIHLRAAEPGADRAALLEALAAMRREADAVEVPLSYMEEYYNLRTHIALVEHRVREGGEGSPGAQSAKAEPVGGG